MTGKNEGATFNIKFDIKKNKLTMNKHKNQPHHQTNLIQQHANNTIPGYLELAFKQK